jgi:hypothetical protein
VTIDPVARLKIIMNKVVGDFDRREFCEVLSIIATINRTRTLRVCVVFAMANLISRDRIEYELVAGYECILTDIK